MSEDKLFRVALKGAVFNGDKFLIVKRSDYISWDNGLWEIPGGRMEFGETPEQTLERELQEEVGLSVDIIKPISTWSFSVDERTQLVGMTYLCRFKDGEVNLSFEHLDYAWIDFNELDDYDIVPGVIKEIENWDREYIKIMLEKGGSA